MLDTTLIYNQVKIPTEVTTNTTVQNMPSIPDSLHVFISDVVNVAQEKVDPTTFWGMTPEWGAIVIPTVATILVFVVGILIDIALKKYNKMHETDVFRDTVFSWVDIVNEPVANQIRRIRQLADDIHQNSTLQNVRFEFSKSMVDKLDVASAENIIQYFLFNSSKPNNDERAKHAFNIVSILDFLSAVEDQIGKQYEAYQVQSMALMQEWNPVIIKLQNIIHSGVPSPAERTIISRFLYAYNNWQQASLADEEVNVNQVYQMLIQQGQRIFVDYTLGRVGYEKADSVIIALKELELIYTKWQALNNGFENVFRNYADASERSYANLCAAVDYFKNNTKAKYI